MAIRKDIMTPRTSNGKTYWTRIGVAWVNENGGISLDFEALPIPAIDEKTGQIKCRAILLDAKQKTEGAGKDMGNMHDDDVPF